MAQLFKLPKDMIDYLWECIDVAKKKKICHKKKLAGCISQTYLLDDPQNLIIENLLNRDDNLEMSNFIENELNDKARSNPNVSLPIDIRNWKPRINSLWVNFQKKGEFQPVHNHTGLLSFVIWMDIPYDWKDETKLPFARSNTKSPPGGNFSFVHSTSTSRSVLDYNIMLSPEMNGYCCVFPSDLCHQVYPFYTSDKERISISGNIVWDEVHKGVKQIPFIVSNT
jgi:hypothetical protein